MRREDSQPGVLEGHEAHEDVAVLAVPAHLVGISLHRLVAVVPIGDQELGLARGRLDGGDRSGL